MQRSCLPSPSFAAEAEDPPLRPLLLLLLGLLLMAVTGRRSEAGAAGIAGAVRKKMRCFAGTARKGGRSPRTGRCFRCWSRRRGHLGRAERAVARRRARIALVSSPWVMLEGWVPILGLLEEQKRRSGNRVGYWIDWSFAEGGVGSKPRGVERGRGGCVACVRVCVAGVRGLLCSGARGRFRLS